MTRRDQVRLARLACERKAAEIGLRNQRGVHRLDGIAGVAFLLGVFLTLVWILSCFGSLTGDKYTHFFYLMGALGRSLRPCVIGLLVGIPAKLVAAYIRAQAEELAVEMQSAMIQLELELLRWHCPAVSGQNDRGRPSTCSAT